MTRDFRPLSIDPHTNLDVALRESFGFDGFRAAQREVVESVLAGRDTVVVMPTGSGKSLCFQLPALVKQGLTVVISPLIALMKDQVEALQARNIAATFINSTLTSEEQRERIAAMGRGQFKLVYVAPERFRSQYFVETLRAADIALFAVDEAHCISQWGHDFRPDYLRLKQGLEAIGRPPVVALTATATPYVRADIAQQLDLRQPAIFVSGFDRPNLFLQIAQVANEREKIAYIKRLMRAYPGGSGIIYAATRKAVEQVTADLQASGVGAVAYHAGLGDEARVWAQDAFMSGRQGIIVATNAFGMGIDKPDIRFVAHYQMPGSLEAYYQEIGRAGRDGATATCLLLFNYADKRTQEFFIEGSYPPWETIESVYHTLVATKLPRIELSVKEIAGRAALRNEIAVQSALIILEKAGHLERGSAAENRASLRLSVPPPEARQRASTRETQTNQILLVLLNQYGLNERAEAEVNLHEVADGLGLEVASVRRALGSLVAAQILSYTPARRTRGITMLDNQPVRKLRVDYRELDNRAALERRKLREVISFCYAEQCFRAYLLDYFGDVQRLPHCAACSHCTPHINAPKPELVAAKAFAKSRKSKADKEFDDTFAPSARVAPSPSIAPPSRLGDAVARPLTADETLAARKMLACAARMQGRFGKQMLAAVLRGAKEKKLLQAGLDRLSTYNLLSHWTQARLLVLVDALLAAGCLRLTQGDYATVDITPFGEQVMREQAVTELALPEEDAAPVAAETRTIRANGTQAETYRLYQQGLSLAEIAAARNLAVTTIETHLSDCIRQGWTVVLTHFVNDADRLLIEQAAGEHGTLLLSPLRAVLPEHISYGQIRLVVAAQEHIQQKSGVCYEKEYNA